MKKFLARTASILLSLTSIASAAGGGISGLTQFGSGSTQLLAVTGGNICGHSLSLNLYPTIYYRTQNTSNGLLFTQQTTAGFDANSSTAKVSAQLSNVNFIVNANSIVFSTTPQLQTSLGNANNTLPIKPLTVTGTINSSGSYTIIVAATNPQQYQCGSIAFTLSPQLPSAIKQ
jgi:hypothetical protein